MPLSPAIDDNEFNTGGSALAAPPATAEAEKATVALAVAGVMTAMCDDDDDDDHDGYDDGG